MIFLKMEFRCGEEGSFQQEENRYESIWDRGQLRLNS